MVIERVCNLLIFKHEKARGKGAKKIEVGPEEGCNGEDCYSRAKQIRNPRWHSSFKLETAHLNDENFSLNWENLCLNFPLPFSPLPEPEL